MFSWTRLQIITDNNDFKLMFVLRKRRKLQNVKYENWLLWYVQACALFASFVNSIMLLSC